MGRPPSNGGPSFRFNPTEVAEMEAILQAHNTQVPTREVLISLAEKFSNSSDRSGKVTVQMKQVWNWFQNRRYALRAKAAKVPVKLSTSPVPPNDLAVVRNVPQAPQHMSVPPTQAIPRNLPPVLQPISCPSAVQVTGQSASDSSVMEFEAKSTRDGAWYDVANFISHRSAETADPEVLVRFSGLGPEEDEWVNIRKHVRQRSLPCEASECFTVLPGDLILCFQEGKDQALYFDAHVLDAQRRRHDVRGCRCRFLVRYDHDQAEEIVPLKKVCRRPETDYRMKQLHSDPANMNQNKAVPEPQSGNTVISTSESIQKLHEAEAPADSKQQPPKVDLLEKHMPTPMSSTNAALSTAAMPNAIAVVGAAAVQPIASTDTTTIPIAQSTAFGATLSAASTTNPAIQFNNSRATGTPVTAAAPVAQSATSAAIPSPASTRSLIAQTNIPECTVPTASTTSPPVHFTDSAAGSTIGVPVLAQPIASGPTSSIPSSADAATQVVESQAAVPAVTPSPVTHYMNSGATLSTVNTSEQSVQLVESEASDSVVAVAPASHSMTTGVAASTSQDVNSDLSGSATSSVTTTTLVSDVSAVSDSVVTATMLAPNSDVLGLAAHTSLEADSSVAAPTSLEADSDVAGSANPAVATTTMSQVAIADCAGTTDSVVTTTTRASNPIPIGEANCVAPTTALIANSDNSGAAESVDMDMTEAAGSGVSEVTNSSAAATEERQKGSCVLTD